MSMSNEMSNLVKFILKYTARPKEEKKAFVWILKSKCLRVSDLIIFTMIIMFLACYVFGNSSSN